MSKSLREYQAEAMRTEPSPELYDRIAERMQSVEYLRILHAAMGLCTEVGELMDSLKKSFYYGKPLDRVNLAEEGGDLAWYLCLLGDVLRGRNGVEEMIEIMIRKLKIRYPDKFTEEKAENRDLAAERKELES